MKIVPVSPKKYFNFVIGMKEKILQQAKALAKKAKETGKSDVEFTLKSGNTTSLGKAIKTQEQADLFMKMLNAL